MGWCASPLKKAYADGTIAVDMDPLSLLWSASYQRAPTAPAHHPLRGSVRFEV
jgi:hypothetical protein